MSKIDKRTWKNHVPGDVSSVADDAAFDTDVDTVELAISVSWVSAKKKNYRFQNKILRNDILDTLATNDERPCCNISVYFNLLQSDKTRVIFKIIFNT